MSIAEQLEPESLLTSYQVGTLLQVNPSSVNKWVKDGRIEAFRTPGGHRRIRACDLVTFLQTHSMPIPKNLVNASKRRLLVVDDDEKQLRAIERLLKPYGQRIHVEFASNGIDALVRVGAYKPHVVLIDVLMEELDGIEVCRRLKDNPELSELNVMLCTGQLTDDIEERARQAGASVCLAKPIDVDDFLKRSGIEVQATV